MADDNVDRQLFAANGQVERGRDSVMCQHGVNSKCAHCLPIDPYDESYLRSRDIKHMSFHAYLRKLRSTRKGRGDQVKHPLENLVCHVKSGCTDHRPYPEGICSKCRPSTVTLSRQSFRHVDNVAFENAHIANRFCDYWRQSGMQRAAFLIGKYDVFSDVPLGIKASVACIYEPPQISSEGGIELMMEHEEIGKARALSESLGLQIVGWTFTDLTPHPKSAGKVVFSRGAHSYFLSAQECITAGVLQNRFANASSLSSSGVFGSRFVTAVASGDSSEQVHFSGYQVSNQCGALVADHLLLPVKKCPELAYIRDVKLRPDHYLVDVQYTEKDEYGNEVRRNGRPLPVEYLLVDVPSGVPTTEQFTFYYDQRLEPFPIENREHIGRTQHLAAAYKYTTQFDTEPQGRLNMCNDWHFLFYLLNNDTYPFDIGELKPLLEAVRANDSAKAFEWLSSNEKWSTFEQLMVAHKQDGDGAWTLGDGEPSAKWTCVHCTYENTSGNRGDCEVCGLPQTA